MSLAVYRGTDRTVRKIPTRMVRSCHDDSAATCHRPYNRAPIMTRGKITNRFPLTVGLSGYRRVRSGPWPEQQQGTSPSGPSSTASTGTRSPPNGSGRGAHRSPSARFNGWRITNRGSTDCRALRALTGGAETWAALPARCPAPVETRGGRSHDAPGVHQRGSRPISRHPR